MWDIVQSAKSLLLIASTKKSGNRKMQCEKKRGFAVGGLAIGRSVTDMSE